MPAVHGLSETTNSARVRKQTPGAERRKKKSRDPLPLGSLKGCAAGISALFVLLALFTSAAAGTENPGILYLPFSLCSLYLGALAAGIGAVRCTQQPVLSGLTSGALYALCIFLMSLLPLPESGLPSSVYWILLFTVIPAAVLGSILGQRRAKRPAYRR